MPATTREAALAAARAATARREPVKFLDLDAFVAEMSAGERDAFEAAQAHASKTGTALDNFRSKLVSRCLVNEIGERLFGEEDLDVLARVPSSALLPVYDAAVRINGLGAEAREAARGN